MDNPLQQYSNKMLEAMTGNFWKRHGLGDPLHNLAIGAMLAKDRGEISLSEIGHAEKNALDSKRRHSWKRPFGYLRRHKILLLAFFVACVGSFVQGVTESWTGREIQTISAPMVIGGPAMMTGSWKNFWRHRPGYHTIIRKAQVGLHGFEERALFQNVSHPSRHSPDHNGEAGLSVYYQVSRSLDKIGLAKMDDSGDFVLAPWAAFSRDNWSAKWMNINSPSGKKDTDWGDDAVAPCLQAEKRLKETIGGKLRQSLRLDDTQYLMHLQLQWHVPEPQIMRAREERDRIRFECPHLLLENMIRTRLEHQNHPPTKPQMSQPTQLMSHARLHVEQGLKPENMGHSLKPPTDSTQKQRPSYIRKDPREKRDELPSWGWVECKGKSEDFSPFEICSECDHDMRISHLPHLLQNHSHDLGTRRISFGCTICHEVSIFLFLFSNQGDMIGDTIKHAFQHFENDSTIFKNMK
jgi:hypothetical protein